MKSPHFSKFEPDEYYLSPEGYIVFTEKYHLKRGYCCQNNCRHCPWKEKKKTERNPPASNTKH